MDDLCSLNILSINVVQKCLCILFDFSAKKNQICKLAPFVTLCVK